jgi:diguanylate cyclase (GGDEF)-like protein
VLVEMSRRLSAALRDYDASGRYGGEEFILLLPGLGRQEAEKRLDAIRQEISAEPFNVQGEQMKVTASFGYAVLGAEDTVPSLLMRADKALYRAKAMGRDRVCFGAEEDAQATIPAGSEAMEGTA